MYHVTWNPAQAARFDYELLDDEYPFEVDRQIAHLFKHATLGLEDAYEVWDGNPRSYPAEYAPAHWLLTGEVPGDQVLTVPLCPGKIPQKCRPIGVYPAPRQLDRQYRQDTR
jgi:hypothetical protein